MNKDEALTKARDLVQRVGETGGRAWTGVGDATSRAWNRAIDAPTDAGRRQRIVLIGVGLAALLIGVIFVLTHLPNADTQTADVDTRQAVSAVTVATHPFEPVISLNGAARPVRDIQVSAPATGVRILELLVDEGQSVRAGQPMARLDTALTGAQTRAAQANVAEAQSAAVRARGEYDRAESIRSSGALSSEAIEARRAAAVAADARLAAAQAQLQETNARLGGGYVRAPAAGLVIDRTAEVGRSVEGQVLFRIAANNELEVAADVAESDILALAANQPAIFRLVDGSTVQATLRRLPASIDPRTRTGEALFTLPRGTRVVAGMFLRGEARLPRRAVIAAPQDAILYAEGTPYVFLIGADNRVRRTNVALGARDGDLVEVIAGLELGQRIVGSGAAFLQDGDVVRPLVEGQEQQQPAAVAGEGERGQKERSR